MKKSRSAAAVLLAVTCLMYASPSGGDITGQEKKVIKWSRSSSISSYLSRYSSAVYPSSVITLNASDFTSKSLGTDISVISDYQGKKDAALWSGESGSVSWNFFCNETGFYTMALEYIPVPYKGMNIEFDVFIDGKVPHDDFLSVRFPRMWKNAHEIRCDETGNELVPRQEEVYQWTVRPFIDTQGFFNKELPVYIEKGKHTLTLTLKREALAFTHITFRNIPDPVPYAQYSSSLTALQKKASADNQKILVKVQGEHASAKSDSTLIPTYDRTDAATEPAHPAKIRLNTIGGSWTWKLPGQWIEWNVEIPQDGMYRFFIKARQNYQRGMAAVRKLYIDGEIPAAEFENIEFPYSLEWDVFSPVSEISVDGSSAGTKASKNKTENCAVYLTKGTHTIRLESTLGRLTPILTAVDDLAYEVNTLRRRFVMIMGSEPDLYRDYQLEKEIPGLSEKLLSLSKRFNQQADEFEKITGQKGTEAATLRILRDQLASFAEEPQYIPHKQTNFRDNIANLAAWILYRKEIPLEVDYLGFASPDAKLPRAKALFIEQQWMNIRSFAASFFEDYNSIGRQEKNAVTVWIQSGRDQAQILRNLITNSFTPETGIQVNLSLVQGSVIEATLAGRGPEIAINMSRGQPVNLASRGALYDLSKFDNFDDITKRFYPSAMVPYQYRGGVYALPLTQDFHMMFYRKDIFDELGITPPETWDELHAVIPVLQRNNMQVGLPYQSTDALDLIDAGMGARNLFPALLAQHGGSFYLNEGKNTGLMEAEAYAAFKQWVDFYASYGFTLKYDFYSRFRSGEMPLGIASYGLYNMLTAAAPEIRNEWAMLPIPGRRMEDGSVNRSESASGSSVIMFKHIKNPEDGWKFLEWWTSAEVQLAYAGQLETLLGTAARLNTANIGTFDRMMWSKAEQDIIKQQWQHVTEIPEVPGGYYTIRMLDTAFSQVYYSGKNPRATLYKYCRMIDEEIARKQKELGINE